MEETSSSPFSLDPAKGSRRVLPPSFARVTRIHLGGLIRLEREELGVMGGVAGSGGRETGRVLEVESNVPFLARRVGSSKSPSYDLDLEDQIV